MSYCHLHLHSDYSMLDGVGRSIEYAELAARLGHPAVAITDHGNLYGVPQHFRACQEHGVKPIAGCEFYANDNRGRDAEVLKGQAKQAALAAGTLDPTFTDAHIVCLAQSQEGWKNLLRLNHDAVLNGYYYQPRTTHDKILEHSDGLIVTTACIGSAFGTYARLGKAKELRALMGKFRDRMGDRFLCELHFNELEEQKAVNDLLIRTAKDLRVPLVSTLDVHYACQSDAAHQQEMIAVSRRQLLSEPGLFKLTAQHLFYADSTDVAAIAKKLGYRIDKRLLADACHRTVDVAASCQAQIYADGELKPPRYIDDRGRVISSPMPIIRQRAVEGFKELFAKVPASRLPHYIARLKHELTVIDTCKMGDFYLVTADVTDFCRRHGILYWVRGSGCASLVARCLQITGVDPMAFDLLFERFVDPSRPNAPDFDMDIDVDRRQEVIDWFTKKYGGEHGEKIARICAITTFGLKSAIKDVLWVNEAPSQLVNSLGRAADRIKQSDKSIEKNLAGATVLARPEAVRVAFDALREHVDDKAAPLLEQHKSAVVSALEMVGRVRGRNLHAAGYVVAPDPLVHHLPIDRTVHPITRQPIIISAWGEGQATQDIGPTGLMKIDLLALDTLAVVSRIAADIRARHGVDVFQTFAAPEFDFSDRPTLEQLASGDGFGIHQFGSTSQELARLAATMPLRNVRDVVALIALYRPGSMDFAEAFRLRSTGQAAVPKVHPIFDEVTRETCGILVYQEQIMQVLHRLGGIPLREAHNVIKAISKKKLDKVQQPRQRFVEESVRRGLTPEQAADIFATVEQFAGYGFNKAHAVSYGVLAYYTAWLRARYPAEFYCGWLNSTPNQADKGNGPRKVQQFMKRADLAGVRLVPPSIGHSTSRWQYIPATNSLLAPLSLVSGIGDKAADLSAAACRAAPWQSLWDFLRWAETNRGVFNAKTLLAAAHVGAFARWATRAKAVALIEAFAEIKPSKSSPRTDRLIALCRESPGKVFVYREDDATDMAFETKALGFPFWVNPWTIRGRSEKLRRLLATGAVVADDTRADRSRQDVCRVYYVESRTDRQDRRKQNMAFLTLSSRTGRTVKGIAFASCFDDIYDLTPGNVYAIRGSFESTAADASFIIGRARRSTDSSPVVEALDDIETV